MALVSELPGTTTDPVFKISNCYRWVPVLLIPLAWMIPRSDPSVLKTRQIIKSVDIAILVLDPYQRIDALKSDCWKSLQEKLPLIKVVTKADIALLILSSRLRMN